MVYGCAPISILHGTARTRRLAFSRSPHIPQSLTRIADRGTYFASRGLPFLSIDARGTARSGGKFQPFIQEAQDGYDVVEWLAKQPYCNGKVSMWGGSYAGYNQWVTAKEFPAHLTTIVPVASPYAGADLPFNGHAFAPYQVQWLTFYHPESKRPPRYEEADFWNTIFREWYEAGAALKDLDTRVGNPSTTFQRWLEHPYQDAYWDSFNPTAEQYAAISVPILSITGIYDEDQLGALAHYRQHMRNASSAARERHYLVIGPWDHGGTRTPALKFRGITVGAPSLVDLPQLHVDWYAWTMAGGRRPEFLKNKVAYYVMSADRWRYAESLDAVTATSLPLFLDSTANPTDLAIAGTLRAAAPRGKPDGFLYDPRDVSGAALEIEADTSSLTEQRVVQANRGKHLVYQTTPYAEDTEVSGFFRLSTWISIDQPDTDFRVTVYEVAQDGSTVALSQDLVRARYREDPRTPRLIDTKAPLRYDFNQFPFVSRQIKKGSVLRLIIGPNNSVYTEKNYNTGGVVAAETVKDARPVNVVVHHSQEYPSIFYVPLGLAD